MSLLADGRTSDLGASAAMRVVAHGPGRVNLIGEHTDYNGGLALPFAIERGVTVIADRRARRRDQRAGARPRRGGHVRARRIPAVRGTTTAGARSRAGRSPSWPPRARTCVPRVVVERDLPHGAGLSSSAALAAGLCLALLGLAGEAEPGPGDRHELARLCSRVENDWVGAQTGLLDQLAALCGEPGRALRIDFAHDSPSSRCRSSSRTGGSSCSTPGAAHTHAGSGYNERRAECEAACARLGVETLSEADPAAADALPEPLRRRARHVLTENARVKEMVAALEAGDLADGGRAPGRLPRQPARRLRRVGPRGGARGGGAQGRGRDGRPHGRWRLRRRGARPARPRRARTRRSARGRARRRRTRAEPRLSRGRRRAKSPAPARVMSPAPGGGGASRIPPRLSPSNRPGGDRP